MKFFSMEVLKSQKGLSLIEVVVSSVIISILLISFISFFLHTTKTTNSSDQIIHATYTAQTEMEHIYSYTNKSYNELEGYLIQDGYERIEARRAEFSKSYKKNSKNGEIIYISTKENIEGNTDLNGIVIEVFEMNGGTEKLKSIVENVFIWGGTL